MGYGPEVASIDDLRSLDLRVGTVVSCELNDGARDPAYAMQIDLGGPDPVPTSAKVTDRYEPGDLIGRQVVVVCGFEPMRVGGFRSDVLVLGALTDEGVVLLQPGEPVDPGSPVA